MKHDIIPCFAVAGIAALVAPAVLAADAAKWETDLPAALAKAAAEKKQVFVLFTGSDWCGPCIATEKNVLSKPEFAAYAADKYILVELDFPEKALPAAQTEANEAAAKKYGVRAFPTFLVLDDKGNVVKKAKGGKRDLASLIKALK